MNRAAMLKNTLLFISAAMLLIGCAGPSGPDDDDPPVSNHAGVYSVLLDPEELGIAALQAFDNGDSSTVVLSDLGYPYNYDQVVVGVDSLGDYLWYRTLPSGWQHRLFKTDAGWTAIGYKSTDAGLTTDVIWVTTMETTGGLKRSRSIALPDSLRGSIRLNDVVMASDDALLFTGSWYTFDTGEDILDVDIFFARVDLVSDQFEWVEHYGVGPDYTLRWYYGDYIAYHEDADNAFVAGRFTAPNEISGDLVLFTLNPDTGSFVRGGASPVFSDLTPEGLAMNELGGVAVLSSENEGGAQWLHTVNTSLIREWGMDVGENTVTSLSYSRGDYILGIQSPEGYPAIWTVDATTAGSARYDLFEETAEVLDAAMTIRGHWVLAGRATTSSSLSDAQSWVARANSSLTVAAPDSTISVPH